MPYDSMGNYIATGDGSVYLAWQMDPLRNAGTESAMRELVERYIRRAMDEGDMKSLLGFQVLASQNLFIHEADGNTAEYQAWDALFRAITAWAPTVLPVGEVLPGSVTTHTADTALAAGAAQAEAYATSVAEEPARAAAEAASTAAQIELVAIYEQLVKMGMPSDQAAQYALFLQKNGLPVALPPVSGAIAPNPTLLSAPIPPASAAGPTVTTQGGNLAVASPGVGGGGMSGTGALLAADVGPTPETVAARRRAVGILALVALAGILAASARG